MTPEQLDEVRAREAWRINSPSLTLSATMSAWWERAIVDAARLGREGWEPVDPLLVRAREICSRKEFCAFAGGCMPEHFIAGERDTQVLVRLALAALAEGVSMGRAEAPEVKP